MAPAYLNRPSAGTHDYSKIGLPAFGAALSCSLRLRSEMAWAAAVRHWSGLLWALSGAVGWMITKPLWCVVGRIVGAVLEFVIKWTGLCKTCIRRYRIFADYVRIAERTSAVRRWKLYEALF
ncbi:hypothetical protein PInf_020282 [Phytophthora infestans]|nr:hypothetical protein PInf_020282 [Phytophthora infestans]